MLGVLNSKTSLFVYDWLHYVFERKHESLEILNFLLQNFQKGIDCTCQMSMDTFHCMRRAVGIQLISSASNDWYKPMSIVYYSGHLMEILPYICLLATKHTNTSSRATSFCTWEGSKWKRFNRFDERLTTTWNARLGGSGNLELWLTRRVICITLVRGIVDFVFENMA
jgi:hypothetical protein